MENNHLSKEIEEGLARVQKMNARQRVLRILVVVLIVVCTNLLIVLFFMLRENLSNKPLSLFVITPTLITHTYTITPTLVSTTHTVTPTITFTPSPSPTPIPNISGTWVIVQSGEHFYNMNPKKTRCNNFFSTYHSLQQTLELVQLPDGNVEGKKFSKGVEPSLVEGKVSGNEFVLQFIDYSIGSTATEQCSGTFSETEIEASCDYIKLPNGDFCFASGPFIGTLEK